MISNRDSAANETHWAWEWGTYRVDTDGSLQPLASPRWNWGKFYEGVVRSVFDGSWNTVASKESQRAINYWWGMNSGVIDVAMSPTLPEGASHIARILKQGLISGSINPFDCKLTDQAGQLRNENGRLLSTEEIMNMDWLLENVEGEIPEYEELLPVSQQLVRLLGLHRDQIQPLPEESVP